MNTSNTVNSATRIESEIESANVAAQAPIAITNDGTLVTVPATGATFKIGENYTAWLTRCRQYPSDDTDRLFKVTREAAWQYWAGLRKTTQAPESVKRTTGYNDKHGWTAKDVYTYLSPVPPTKAEAMAKLQKQKEKSALAFALAHGAALQLD